MPHVEIKSFPRELTTEQTSELAEEMTKLLQQYLQCREGSVSIALKYVAQEDWKASVWDTQIAPERDQLIKKPDYSL